MKIRLIFLSILFISLNNLASEIKSTQINSKEQFELYKKSLPTELQNFVNEFENWSKEDQEKIEIFGLSFSISELSPEKQSPYEGSIGYWIDCRTNNPIIRTIFIYCLEYIQKH